MTTALIVFVKNPDKGRAKTRIAAEVGDEMAKDIYIQLLEICRNLVKNTKTPSFVYYDETIDEEDSWQGDHITKCLQVASSDLGHKMYRSFIEVLSLHESAVIIGSDCPYITPSIILQAYDLLQNKDVVIGPTLDGGYYLLGMKKAHFELFADMTWSHDRVCEETISKCKKADMSYALLKTLQDVDYYEDWVKYLEMSEVKD